MAADGLGGPPAIEIDTHCEGRRRWFGDADLPRYSSEIAACCNVASNTNRRGAVGVHGFQVMPRAALFGSPVRMNAARLCCITLESANLPGLLASLQPNASRFIVKLPKMKARSSACHAP